MSSGERMTAQWIKPGVSNLAEALNNLEDMKVLVVIFGFEIKKINLLKRTGSPTLIK